MSIDEKSSLRFAFQDFVIRDEFFDCLNDFICELRDIFILSDEKYKENN